jgi:hypothetical protein
MSLFKFHDSNYLNGFNNPNIVATGDTYNGEVFAVSYGATVNGVVTEVAATPIVDATATQAGDFYVMWNIIDKPEILNTEDYKVGIGEKIRGFKFKDYVGQMVDISADLVTDDYTTVAVGNYIIPRSLADTTDTKKWKKSASVTGYEVYLQVVKKTTFGTFTIDAGGGTVKGGYLCVIKSTN